MDNFYNQFYSNNIKNFTLNTNEFEQSTNIYLEDNTLIKPIVNNELYNKTFFDKIIQHNNKEKIVKQKEKIVKQKEKKVKNKITDKSNSDFQKFRKSENINDNAADNSDFQKFRKSENINDNAADNSDFQKFRKSENINDNAADNSDFQKFRKSENITKNAVENFLISTPVNSVDIATNLSTLTTYIDYNQFYIIFHDINLYINSTNLSKELDKNKPLVIVNIYKNNTFNISQSYFIDINTFINDNHYIQILSYANVSKLLIKQVIELVEKLSINIKDENNKKKRKVQLVNDIIETFQKKLSMIKINYDDIM